MNHHHYRNSESLITIGIVNPLFDITVASSPVVLKVGALGSDSAVELVDDAHDDRVGESRHQPQEVGTVCCKQATLQV